MRVRAAWAAMMPVGLLYCWVAAAALLWSTGVDADSAIPLAGNESGAMQRLRDTLGIRESAWQSDLDPCGYWRGLTCSNGHIQSILLTGLPRTGAQTHPKLVDAWSLTQLPFLTTFNASQFTFDGGIPDWFGNLGSLVTLDLSHCSLTGGLPSSFGRLSRLTNLSLARNSLGGTLPLTLANFTSLVSLNLSMNSFYGSIPSLTSPVLQTVDLSGNQFTGGVAPLTALPSLQYLSVANNMLDMAVPWELGNLAALRILDLSMNMMPGGIPPELGRLANLTEVRLSRNNFGGFMPAELTGWSQLQVMELDHNNLTGDIPSTINLLQNLVKLDLSVNRFTGVYTSGLLTLPWLQTLNLSHNLFHGPLPQELGMQELLATLDMSDNYFNGTVPMGFLPSANIRTNCLALEERQRTLRACTTYYAPLGVTFSFNATPPIDNSGDAPPPPYYASTPLETTSLQQGSSGSKLTPLLAGVLGGMGLILFVGVMVFCLHRCQMRRSKDRGMDSGRVSAIGGRGQTFSYSQLSSATSKFSSSNLTCMGHSGDLYRGEMSGTAVVVKKIDLRRVSRQFHMSELEVFDKVSHTKMVQLLGTCLDREDEKYLVYKYCPNIDLATSLHKKGNLGVHCEDVLQSLDWITRLKIAIGVADGLSYLHSECTPPIIHRYALHPKEWKISYQRSAIDASCRVSLKILFAREDLCAQIRELFCVIQRCTSE